MNIEWMSIQFVWTNNEWVNIFVIIFNSMLRESWEIHLILWILNNKNNEGKELWTMNKCWIISEYIFYNLWKSELGINIFSQGFEWMNFE